MTDVVIGGNGSGIVCLISFEHAILQLHSLDFFPIKEIFNQNSSTWEIIIFN